MTLWPGGSIFPREDFDVILHYARGLARALEFGPGVSTLAFVEAGCQVIDTYEYQVAWLGSARRRLAKYPQVSVRRFINSPDIIMPDEFYDIALVDSPLGNKRRQVLPGQEKYVRLNTLRAALSRAPVVLLHDAKRPGERLSLEFLRECGHVVEFIETERGMAVVYA